MTNPARTPNPRGEGDAPVVAAIAPEQAQARRRRDSVGELLRQTRLSYGADIETTAASLRIRRSYLSAIEEGRYDELPGLVYALGFVRAYAVYLGLDGDEAVRRFKRESAGLERPRDLSFPLPLTKHSIPGGRMLLAALVLAVCGYGLWYYLSTGDRSRPEQVSAVPAQLLPPAPAPAPAAPPAAAAAPAPSTAATMETPAATLPAPASPAAAPPAAPAPIPPATPEPAAATPKPPTSASESAVTAVPLPPATDAHPTAPAVASLPSATPPPPAPPVTNTAEKPPPVAAAPPAATAGAATAMAVPPASAAAGEPRVFGAVNGPTRIIIRAIGDCWLQVRDPDDALVAQRTLHKNDTYRVPEQPGLVMRTGNASALEIIVDGKPVRPIGGTVRHVLLDPQRLLAGTATNE